MASLQAIFQKALSMVWPLSAVILSICVAHSVAASPAQAPLFLTAPVKPLMMLNMSNDHQLFFKAYDDYSDITDPNGGAPDGNADTTYVHNYDYYGYFDSDKCYVYQNSRFEPSGWAAGKYCSGTWSGNFLNWATMTRIDSVRKVLYGGLRQVDSVGETVLERSLLPNDAHSFTKYYNGTDINRLTPFSGVTSGQVGTASTGITICNTTDPSNRSQFSQAVTDPPLMRIAAGNYSLWASNERWQCRWGTANNGNNPALTGMWAHAASPSFNTNRLGTGDYNVRVKVCVPGLINDNNNENCRAYGVNFKPSGLLQEFGETGSILFGLMTGSYARNKSGGVLRKNIGLISDEVNSNTGVFMVPNNGNSIIRTLNLLRIYGYDFNEGVYNNASGDNCPWAIASFADGRCSNWGNPQSEIYLESLRYLAGRTATAAFSANDSSRIAGLNTATWVAPVTNDNYCAPLSVIQFNASTSSYDGDALAGASDIGLANLNNATDHVGSHEDIHGRQFFVGETATNTNQLCTAKTINNLSAALGTCPDAPRLQGSYQIAGLAHHARRNGIQVAGLTQAKPVYTYGVSLAAAVPRVSIPVPGSDRQVTILPACRNTITTPNNNCSIVDFKIIKQESTTVNGNAVNSGSLYVNWEDSEQGGDYDQDMWGIINYEIAANQAVITTRVIAQSTGDPMGFGYVISGTGEDGFHVHSGVNNFLYGGATGSCTNVDGNRCTCRLSASGTAGTCDNPQSAARSKTFSYGTSAQPLELPLYYAAKWGGYSDDLEKQAKELDVSLDALVKARDPSDSYFFATDPRELEASLRAAFIRVAAGIGTASSAATNSTRLNDGSRFYQALFDSEHWTGTLKALAVGPSGQLVDVAGATTDTYFDTASSIDNGRRIFTRNTETDEMVAFQWDNLSSDQQDYLRDGTTGDGIGINRLNWIRGSRTHETAAGGMRVRTKLMGDIVNSNPVYSGNPTHRYTYLPEGGVSYQAYAQNKAKVLYVGANDGMLHAFDVDTFQELFAYIPSGVYPKLSAVSKPNYGTNVNPHQYLMDGPLYVGDAYLNNQWRTVLVGALGAGGRGVFALDVTDPSQPELIFEIGPDVYPQLGHILGQPYVAPLKNGRWAAVFGNGYGFGSSQLFVVDLEDPKGAHTRVIDTGGGTGLSTPSLLPNTTSQVEVAYAGDLQGNIWKFSLSEGTRQYGEPLFVARDSNNNRQPITGGVTLGSNLQIGTGVVMVYFGTGKYFDVGDNVVTASPHQSFYAIADIKEPLTYSSRQDILHEKTMSEADGVRTVHGEVVDGENGFKMSAVDWSSKKGWYLDFVTNGERVISKPLLIKDRLVFNTVIPSEIPCQYGGKSWLMELIAVGDKNLNYSYLAENANIEIDSLVVGEPSIQSGSTEGRLLNCKVDGTCEIIRTILGEGNRGRINWREYR